MTPIKLVVGCRWRTEKNSFGIARFPCGTTAFVFQFLVSCKFIRQKFVYGISACKISCHHYTMSEVDGMVMMT